MTEKQEEIIQFPTRVTEEQKRWLKDEAYQADVKQAEIVRTALDHFRKLNPEKRKKMYANSKKD